MDKRELLHTEQLCYHVGNTALLQDISLALPRGELSVLIGPNGAGKSTLLRLLCGYLQPSSGNCWLNGKLLSQFTPADLAHLRAVMRQHSRLNFPFRAEEIVRMGGSQRRRAEVEQYLEPILTQTECQSLRHKPYHQLSGGEQQRIQLARALLQLWSENMCGKLLFLDEPTSAFDLHHQQQSLRLLRQLCQQYQLTVCCVLHDLNLAALYADHIILLAENRIQAQGCPKQVLNKTLIQRWYQAEIEMVAHHALDLPQLQFCR